MGRHAAAEPLQGRCPLCLTPIQQTPGGTVADGVRAHYLVVHPGEPVPRA